MKLFFFDTETTWLNSNDQVLQFWGIFWTFDWENFHEERRISQFINVTKEISPDAERVHGISKDKVKNFWYIEDYIDEILLYIKKADYIIWHNLDFDIKMLKQECNRIWQDFARDNIKSFCTMKETIDILNLPGKKRPKLSELYYYLFNKCFNNAHDAMADIEATKDCFIELVKRNRISIWENNYENNNIGDYEEDYYEYKDPLEFYMTIKNIKNIEHADQLSWKTILMYACEKQDKEIVKYLLENGANPNRQAFWRIENSSGWKTALIYAAISYNWEKEIINLLLKYWADIEAKDKYWKTALMYVSHDRNFEATKYLLENGANPNTTTDNGTTAIMEASYSLLPDVWHTEWEDIKTVEILLKYGADIKAKNKEWKTALIIANEYWENKIVSFLIKQWANIEDKDSYGNTPLLLASSQWHKEIVETLLKYGANIETRWKEQVNALLESSSRWHKEIVETLLKYGANPDSKRSDGRTSLMITSSKGYEDIAKILLKYGANANEKDLTCHTALMSACDNWHYKLVRLLIENCVNINEITDKWFTALHYASWWWYKKIVEILLKNWANINIKAMDKVTPLMLANKLWHKEVADILIAEWANF